MEGEDPSGSITVRWCDLLWIRTSHCREAWCDLHAGATAL